MGILLPPWFLCRELGQLLLVSQLTLPIIMMGLGRLRWLLGSELINEVGSIITLKIQILCIMYDQITQPLQGIH